MRKQAIWYVMITLWIIIFTIIYEWFSFGVTSIYMRLSYLIPLCGGMISLMITYTLKPKQYIISLWHMSLFSFLAYMILQGIFEIYGSYEPTVIIFLYLGIIILLLTMSLYIRSLIKGDTHEHHPHSSI